MMKKYALIYNFAQHYRKAIFEMMDKELYCDFFFGDFLDWAPDIKKLEKLVLRGKKKELKNIRFLKYFIWQKGSVSSVIKGDYTNIILYGDSFYLSNWIILIYCKLVGIKTALWTHGLYKKMNWKTKVINYPFYWLADSILLYGNYSKDKMIKLGFNSGKLKILYNSLDYDKQSDIRKSLKKRRIFVDYFNNDKPTFIYIGRIQKIKKLDTIILALEKLKGTLFEFNFVVVGLDKEGVNLELLVKEKGLENNVWFYGDCYDESEIGNLIYNAHICISPGNIGLTAMHSLVYGTPAVTHNNFQNQMPEFEAIEDKITGSFFEEDNIESMIEEIKYWISIDARNRENIRQNCFLKIDKFYNPYYQIEIIKQL